MRSVVTAVCSLLIGTSAAWSQCDPDTVFSNTTTNSVCIATDGAVRSVYTNALPNHETGAFPNPGNPNAIKAQRITLTMCAQPRLSDTKTYLDKGSGVCPFWVFGVGINGLEFDPIANEFFRNTSTGQLNRDWNQNALSPNVNLGLDMNDAHVQPNGKYHYHGDPTKFIEQLGITSTQHSPIVAYAADGFPVYYRYVYASDAQSEIVDAASCFQLKTGERPGDGVSAPNGPYDGTYTQDYEFRAGVGCILDECNGRFGPTPDFPNGTYYYVLTANYPVIPRCFSGYPDKAFTIGPPQQGCATSNANQICTISSVEERSDVLLDLITLAPNPATSTISISFLDPNLHHHLTAVRIFDQTGRQVISLKGASTTLHLDGLAAGLYYVRLAFDGAEVTKIFVKE